jgi:UDP-N-acetylglucosamine 4,6-dehydratase
MKITDLAEAVAPGMPTVQVGIRPGEKLHEAMISGEDGPHTLDIGDCYVIKPRVCRYKGPEGTPMREGFAYTSDANEQWLGVEDLRAMLRQADFGGK